MIKRRLCGIAAVLLILLLSACGRNSSENAAAPTESRSVSLSPTEEKGEPGEETGDMELKLKIGDTESQSDGKTTDRSKLCGNW